jgi:hypothetical protein
MINKEEFEFHKSIVDWMINNGTPFMEAMGIVSYAEASEKCIPQAYLEIRVHHSNVDSSQAGQKKNSESGNGMDKR